MTYMDNRLSAAAAAAGIAIGDERPATRRYVRKYLYQVDDRPPKVPDPLPPAWAAGPGAKRLLDLELDDCRFPVGDATGVDQLFCGDDAHGAKDPPYCPTCARRTWRYGARVNSAAVAA